MPLHTQCIPAVQIFVFFDPVGNISFPDGHCLTFLFVFSDFITSDCIRLILLSFKRFSQYLRSEFLFLEPNKHEEKEGNENGDNNPR